MNKFLVERIRSRNNYLLNQLLFSLIESSRERLNRSGNRLNISPNFGEGVKFWKMKYRILAICMGHLVNCNLNPNYPLADMTPEEKGPGSDWIRAIIGWTRRFIDYIGPKLLEIKSISPHAVHSTWNILRSLYEVHIMNPNKEYEEFMHKLPERCFLIQGMLKHIN